LAEKRSHAIQMAGSLLVAILVVAVVIAVVTAKVGPDGEDERGRDREDNSGRGSDAGGSLRDYGLEVRLPSVLCPPCIPQGGV
jgi:hypothetical protein